MSKFLEKRKEQRKITKPIVVFYHAGCTDGFTAAWVAWKKFGNKAEYVAYTYEDVIPDLRKKRIYTVDLTFENAKEVNVLIKNNIFLTSIDHHITNKERTLATHKPLYDINHSGCTLAWQYFFPNKAVPKFLLAVEDVDLWRHRLPGGQALYNYLDLFDFDFKTYSRLIADFELTGKRKQMLAAGNMLLERSNKIMERHINKSARLVKLAGHTVYAINSTDNTSDMGEKLYKLLPPFAIMWREIKDGKVIVSLRGDGSVDTSAIAQKYGGGGHRNSSGFVLPSLKDIPWKPIKQEPNK